MDIVRLRAVCKTWHSSFPHPLRSSPVFPLQVPCPYKPTDSIPMLACQPFFLYERILLRLSPLDDNTNHDPWIFRVEQTGPKKWSLRDPIQTFFFKNPFPNNSTDQMPHHINLLDYKVGVINRSYHLDGLIHEEFFELIKDVVYEVAVQSNTGTVEADDQNITILILYGFREIAYWRSGDEEWTPVETGECNFAGITCCRGDFYALAYDGGLMRVNLDKSGVEMVIKPPQQVYRYLKFINFDNCLFLMTYEYFWYSKKSHIIYVLNQEDGAWDIATDLRNGVFFCRDETNVLAVSAKDLGCPNGDFVYYKGFQYFVKEEDGGQPGTCSPLVFDKDRSYASLESRWHGLLPFWPPPCWIMQTNKHEGGEILEL